MWPGPPTRPSGWAGATRTRTDRAATPLELLFDLTFVIAFGTAANELAHFLAEDHVGAGIGRLPVRDVRGVLGLDQLLVVRLGVRHRRLDLPADHDGADGRRADPRARPAGHVRVAHARRARRQPGDGARLRRDAGADARAVGARQRARTRTARRVCRIYIVTILVSQVGWVRARSSSTHVDRGDLRCGCSSRWLIELGGPVVAERRCGGTPWHAHHIAERYGLLVIIALGEGLIGTMASLSARSSTAGAGQSTSPLLGLAGTALTFGMWWIYFVVPCGEILHAHRERSFGWGYGHIPLFGAIVAVGAGLHVAAYYLEHHSVLGDPATVLTVAVPLGGVRRAALRALRRRSPARSTRSTCCCIAGSAVVAGRVGRDGRAPARRWSWCLLVLALTPWVTVRRLRDRRPPAQRGGARRAG